MTSSETLTAAADRLDALIAEATPGPWLLEWRDQDLRLVPADRFRRADGGSVSEWTYAIRTWEPEASGDRAECDTADAAYIAAMNPDVGRALVGVLRERAEELADLPPSEQDFVVGAGMPDKSQDQVWRLARAILGTREDT